MTESSDGWFASGFKAAASGFSGILRLKMSINSSLGVSEKTPEAVVPGNRSSMDSTLMEPRTYILQRTNEGGTQCHCMLTPRSVG